MHVERHHKLVFRSIMSRNVPRIEMPESEENEFASLSLFSPSRAPLNSIPDPSQLQKPNHLFDSDLVQKLEGATRTQHHRTLGTEKRFEVLEGRAGNASGMHDSNPKIVNRNGKSRSEPNSAQNTPTRNGPRVSLSGACATGAQYFGGRGTFSRIPKGISMADSVTTPHFELNEDHSFWKEHNVQVGALFRRFLMNLKLTNLGIFLYGVGFDKAKAIKYNGKGYSRIW